jgi:RHS repeat-associated protein
VLAVEECTNSDPNRASLAGTTCARDDGPNRTLYGYHASGQLEVVHDPLGVEGAWASLRHQLRYHFDTAGQLSAIDDPDAGHSETFYDGIGNVVKTINARGQQRVTQYDPLDRRTRLSTPEGDITFGYRAEERQLQVEQGPGYAKYFLYDAFGRVRNEAMLSFGVSQAAGSVYDLLGRRIAIIATGTMIQYEYAGAFLQRVCAVAATDPVPCTDETATAIISGVTYDELGRRSAVQLPGGERTYTYADDDTRELREDEFVGASALTHEYLSHDPLGNLLTWSTAAQPQLNASGSYTYDARNRLAGRTRTADGQPAVAESFGYDELGNLVSHAGEAQAFEHPTKPHALTSRGTQTYAYDDSGNRTRAGSRHFAFDSADRLLCVGSAAGGCDVLRVVYDAAGERVLEQAGGTRRGFIGAYQVRTIPATGGEELRVDILAFGERVAYTINQKPRAAASLRVFQREVSPWLLALFPVAALAWCLGLAFRGGLLAGVARRPGVASVSGVLIVSLAIPYPIFAGGGGGWTRTYRWVLSDPLGSGVLVLDETGLLLHHTRFEPFGGVDGVEYQAASDPQHRRFFAGHPEQSETGLHYMNARWMDPETGTFLSVDPVVASASDPQSLNAYAYARNNPVNLTDPNGMCVNLFACGMILPAYGFGNLTTITTTSTLKFSDKAGNVLSSSSMTWTTYSVNGEWAGSNSSGVSFGGASGAPPSQSGLISGMPSAAPSSAVGDALARVGRILGWDLALAFQGLFGNLYGIATGLLTTLAGIATLDSAKIGSGLSQTFWALVPRYGFWSGPGWGKPNLEANHGSWYGPYSSQSVIEAATHKHDYATAAREPGADRSLIRDVWSRHDLGPYGQVYRVGLTVLFGAGIGLGLGD